MFVERKKTNLGRIAHVKLQIRPEEVGDRLT
jgi:hypothetical protein